MITFMEAKERVKDTEKCLDSQLWHACAGGMVQMPSVSSKVFYFPQGHAEHSSSSVDFRNFPRMPSFILCRVSAIKFMADPETDEVYAKIKLVPISNKDSSFVEDDEEEGVINGGDERVENTKPASFAKTLTQSDANNGGGFSVPRYCAETIFPKLDYSADPPVQTILAKDVHGEVWKFRHIYRGTPRRHLLTTGWSTFVNHKKLVAGDSIVFLRADNGDLCVGIRRAKRGIGGSPESSWNPAGGNCVVPYGGFSAFFSGDENKLLRNGNGNGNVNGNGNETVIGKAKVKAESVVEAATLAANGQPFEVVYYPRASTPEFCVKASMMKSALQIRWCSGLRFKMAFETEDSSRISWFMGTISSVQVADPVRWPDSPWRLLQVSWDEPDLLQNVKRVSPWLVELVSNMPAIHLSPFSPPRKKLRLQQHPDFPLDSQFPFPTFSSNLLGPSSPYGCLSDNNPAGMQGARHAHYGVSLSDLHLNKLQTGLFSAGFPPLFDNSAAHARSSYGAVIQKPSMSESVSCVLSMSHSTRSLEKHDNVKTPQLVLFGQPILTEQQISLSCSGDTVSPVRTGNSSSEGNLDKTTNISDGSGSGGLRQQGLPERLSCESLHREMEPSSETGHCKVFMESEDVGRTLDLSLLNSYDELHRKLADMFGVVNSETFNNVLYRDITGIVKHIGDEPFSEFVKTARRLTIISDSSSDNEELL
ncbi:auxin response factor 18-like [Mercurialis annua]|uniref:auxin response factor 18-like n=1 Tax=Mercurialis annua TaxID=3986 RepID=UPI0024AF778F|nr:auxin response factor 18-like [Mercurialis annua]